jgi:signal transduction histidine kinase
MVADRIVSLGLLAAGLSHHIRNSLVAVKTFLDLAPAKLQEEKLSANELRNPDFWKEYYANVQVQIEKINGLLKDLWSASEKPSEEFRDQVRLRTVIDEAAQKMQAECAAKNITIENQVPDTLPQLQVDHVKFDRLFELLLKDEIVSLPAGSKITFTGHATADDHVELQVRDNGPGLPEEALRLVFDPFALRTDTPLEYGINLMGCYFIVHHHGGKIEAQSEPGQGTTFRLRLPLNSNRPAASGDKELSHKVLLNDSLWQKLIAAD